MTIKRNVQSSCFQLFAVAQQLQQFEQQSAALHAPAQHVQQPAQQAPEVLSPQPLPQPLQSQPLQQADAFKGSGD
jgi:hypothetical protein